MEQKQLRTCGNNASQMCLQNWKFTPLAVLDTVGWVIVLRRQSQPDQRQHRGSTTLVTSSRVCGPAPHGAGVNGVHPGNR